MDIATTAARSRAYKILGLLLERYLTSGVIEIELLGESLTVVTMVKTELLKIQQEIVSSDFDSPTLARHDQPVTRNTNKAKRQRRPNSVSEGQSS